MLVDDIKKRAAEAVKGGDTVARDVLRLALGEIQTAEARKNAPLGEEDAAAALRKLIKSNEESLAALATDDARVATLKREIEVLTSLLPAQLSVEQIVAALAPQLDAIKAAKADGQATGIAMKHLKSTGASVNGADVTAAVKQIRS
ncbi:MAG: GatB/YqeY domain-containing protein [Deltaproteobacteria bacterium]|nr:GatB/YqeY domain-containing protein [Deltaproteobacteria bacterium]